MPRSASCSTSSRKQQRDEVGSPEFAAKAKVLKDLVEHHAEEEEKEMFPRARKLMDKDELQTLGEQLARRKQELKAADGESGDTGDEGGEED